MFTKMKMSNYQPTIFTTLHVLQTFRQTIYKTYKNENTTQNSILKSGSVVFVSTKRAATSINVHQ